MAFESFSKASSETEKGSVKDTGKDINSLDKRKNVENSSLGVEKSNSSESGDRTIDVDKRKPIEISKENNSIKENGYTFNLDKFGRTASAEGELKLDPVERDKNAQLRAGGKDRLKTDDGGHIFATRFGGKGEANLIAQDSKINRIDYKNLENSWAKALSEGKQVYVKVDLKYKGDSLRPDRIKVSYSIDGEKFKKVFSNRPNT